jgi:hypothetical protein
MTATHKNVAAGAIFTVIGAYFCIEAALNLRMGTAFRMGPGYFPIVIGGLLVLFGLAIAFLGGESDRPDDGPVAWRGFILITIAPLVFAVIVNGLGLVPAMLASVFVSAFASRKMTFWLAVILTAALSTFCVLVFSVGLNLPLRLFAGPLAF